MKEAKASKKKQQKQAWRPLITSSRCCSSSSSDDAAAPKRHTICRNLRRCCTTCRLSKTEPSIKPAATSASTPTPTPTPSFRKVSISDLSRSSSSCTRINEDLLSFGGELCNFQMHEMRGATQNFSSNLVLGEGGFGKVYKGFLDDRISITQGLLIKPQQPVAVKVLDSKGLQGQREWLAEVIFLGQLRHPNLVKLMGYCCQDEDRLLVYEFMPRGTVENHLFKRLSNSLSWNTRLKIAIGAAKGLAFLHGAEQPVIYRDFKTSNILLDSDFTPKLSDFGLAKLGPEGSETHVSTRVLGTYGYAAPEYINTGHLTTKSDIYSFGVVLLELLTGRRVMDKSRPKLEQNLVNWTRPYLAGKRKLQHIVDPRLMGHFSIKGSKELGRLAQQCVSLNPKDRPKITVIIRTLEGLLNLKDMANNLGRQPNSTKSGSRVGKGVRGCGCKSAAVVESQRRK